MAKLSVDFDGFDKYIEKFERQQKNIKPAVEKALEETFKTVTPGVKSAVAPHKVTGSTQESLIDSQKVEWTGTIAEIKVGFDLEKEIASQFLVYGARASITGVPYRAPDMKLWNAIFGSAVKRKVADVQREVFARELER